MSKNSKLYLTIRDRHTLPWDSGPGRFFVCYADTKGKEHGWMQADGMGAAIDAAIERYGASQDHSATLSVVREGGGEYFFGEYK